MDLLRSHKTKPVKKLLKENDVTLSLVPTGCTGIVQPVDISFNRPFKDILKEEIDKGFEQADNNIDPDDITGSSTVGEMRVMMTKCVGATWERLCQEKREVIIRSFRCIGASLSIDGTSDGEISIKGLPTPHLMTALQDWKTRGAPTAQEDAASSSDDTFEDSSSSEDEQDDETQPEASDATRSKPRVRSVSGHGRAGRVGRGRGRGRGKNQVPAHLTASTTPAIGGDSPRDPCHPSAPQSSAPAPGGVALATRHPVASATRCDTLPAAEHAAALADLPVGPPDVGTNSFSVHLSVAAHKARYSLSASISEHSTSKRTAPPAVGTRRSARLVGKPQRSHVISLPQITDTEGDEDNDKDGLKYDFRWHADEF